MKISTSSSLFGMFASAIAFLASDRLALIVSASDSSENSNNVPALPLVAAPTITPPVDFELFDPNVNRLSFQGLDLSKPLTKAETTFLESTIQEVFNKIHEDMGIDLYAESVSVGTNGIVSNQTIVNNSIVNNTSSNLRGARKLERNFQGRPGPDFHPCQYQSGPNKGEWMEYCDIDFEVYLCHRCWMCIDDDFEIGENYLPQKPTPVPAPRPTLSDYDRLKMFMDDDYFDNLPPTYKPQAAPTKEPTSAPTKEPTSAPTKEPTSAPTKEPTSAPTKEEVDLEEERGPDQPYRPNKYNPFDKEVLKKLKKSRFHRFRNINNVRFGYGN